MLFVHCCVLLFAYCAVFVAENFYAVAVSCEAVVTCIKPEISNSLSSGFISVVFPRKFNIVPLSLSLDEAAASRKNCFCVFFFYNSLDCFKVKWGLFPV